MKPFFEYTRKNKKIKSEIIYEIRKQLKHIENPLILKISKHILKRELIKGILSYNTYFACGGVNDDIARQIGASMELIGYNFSLCDDIFDKHNVRNNERTLRMKYGDGNTLLAANTLIFLGLKCLSGTKKISKHIWEFQRVYEGMQEMDSNKNRKVDDCLKMNENVNGLFLAVPLRIAATIANNFEKEAYSYGFNAGTICGMVDEVRDLLGLHGRRRATELEDGRIVTPIAMLIELVPNVRDYVGRKLSNNEHKKLVQKLKTTDSFNFCRNFVVKYRNKSLLQLATLPSSRHKLMLEEFPNMMLEEFDATVITGIEKYL